MQVIEAVAGFERDLLIERTQWELFGLRLLAKSLAGHLHSA